jgi:two-component system response regulator TctD
MNLLLVEDDPSMRNTLERALSRRGMRVESCADGRDALALWRARPPDVVVLDLSPGWTACRCWSRPGARGWRRRC